MNADMPTRKEPKPNQFVYFFGVGQVEGAGDQQALLGGRGAKLAEMAGIGLPVPPGFTITTEVCASYDTEKGSYPKALTAQVDAALGRLEKTMGREFGDASNPLLVSVRTGARESMPGTMPTVLNLGLNDATVEGLARRSGNDHFAWDSYRRFVQMYGTIVMGLKSESSTEADPFDAIIEKKKEKLGIHLDAELSIAHLKELVVELKAAVETVAGMPFPSDPKEQLWGAICAAFRSWRSEQATIHRRLNKIPDPWGTAVNVQAMVFGNLGDTSATGVAYTRDPYTGEKLLFGEYLINAQGEDVVAGLRAPTPIHEMHLRFPQIWDEFLEVTRRIEGLYREAQEVEFTIERGVLYVLGSRSISGRLIPAAAVRIAVEMVGEGLIDAKTSVLRVKSDKVDELLRPIIDPEAVRTCIGRGFPASPGVAVGRVEFDARIAGRRARAGEKIILVLNEMERSDMEGSKVAEGILTAMGSRTGHAAVFARGARVPAVTGVHGMTISRSAGAFRIGEREIHAGDWISLDGSTGEVFEGAVPLLNSRIVEPLKTYLEWEARYRPRMAPDIRSLPAYQGDQPFVFVSYSHEDMEIVHGELVRLAGLGFRLWYDEGIVPSNDWREDIAQALDSSAIVLALLSPKAILSSHVLEEIDYALRRKKPCLPVYIADCQLSGDLERELGVVQRLEWHRMLPRRYVDKLTEALERYGVRG